MVKMVYRVDGDNGINGDNGIPDVPIGCCIWLKTRPDHILRHKDSKHHRSKQGLQHEFEVSITLPEVIITSQWVFHHAKDSIPRKHPPNNTIVRQLAFGDSAMNPSQNLQNLSKICQILLLVNQSTRQPKCLLSQYYRR